ncbi:hypothetical protein [Bradyrhizobium jicamae]|uniref:hypothetical protein n=1 Tax=Bradyrhizobium jicamae TaxID=280332 RepID=UPI003D9BE4D5
MKAIFCVVLLLVLASNIWSMSKWSESRGVYDDICYLRQAHLFKRFGLGGIDTNIARDDDQYLAERLKEINYPTWNDPATAPCHVVMAGSGKRVMQYPPGTGFVLSLFPEGFQVIPLYVLTSVVAAGFAMFAINLATNISTLALAGACGIVAIYLMVNPTKASYSVAPTMIVCAFAGLVTAWLFSAPARNRWTLWAVVGLLIGLSVSFRLPNLLLASGYCLFLLAAFLVARNRQTFLAGLSFGVAFLIGLTPTLIANAVNAGSPFATTYGSADVVPPEIDASVLRLYLLNLQFGLLLIAVIWTAALWRFAGRGGKQLAWLVAANLAVNLVFFATHPIFTPYYIMPVVSLSLWTLLFVTLLSHRALITDGVRPWQEAIA